MRIYLVHGLLETALGQFHKQVRIWKTAHQVIPIDLPGHGRCPLDAKRPYLHNCIQYAYQIIHKFGAGHLLGCSYLGSPVAIQLGLAYPTLVKSICVSGFVPNTPKATFINWLKGFDLLAEENNLLCQWYKKQHGCRWRHTLDAYQTNAQQQYQLDINITEADLINLTQPFLLLNGTLKSNEKSAALNLTSKNKNLYGKLIDHAGHVPSNDQPEQYRHCLEDFWKINPLT